MHPNRITTSRIPYRLVQAVTVALLSAVVVYVLGAVPPGVDSQGERVAAATFAAVYYVLGWTLRTRAARGEQDKLTDYVRAVLEAGTDWYVVSVVIEDNTMTVDAVRKDGLHSTDERVGT